MIKRILEFLKTHPEACTYYLAAAIFFSLQWWIFGGTALAIAVIYSWQNLDLF